MSNRKAYLVHLLIFSVLYFMGSSLAVPTLQRRDDEGGSLPSSDLAGLFALWFLETIFIMPLGNC